MHRFSSSLEYYNNRTNDAKVDLMMRVVSQSPFLVEDLVALTRGCELRLSFRVNRKSPELEQARIRTAKFSIGTVFSGKVYLDSEYRQNHGLESGRPWLCFLVSETRLISNYQNLLGISDQKLSSATEIEELKQELGEIRSKFETELEMLRTEVSELKRENKKLESRFKGVNFLIERRTEAIKAWMKKKVH